MALVESEDSDPYFFSQLQDVTDQRRAERQKAVIADLGRLALESADVASLMGEAMALQIRPELVTEVSQQLTQHRITPERLVLEITESLVLDPSIKPVIASLRALGVRLALDDLGTGYSSLGSLQRFPLDLVKLDRTLIESIAEGSGVAVVRAAVELGHALGVNVIAEGIEERLQLDALRGLGWEPPRARHQATAAQGRADSSASLW